MLFEPPNFHIVVQAGLDGSFRGDKSAEALQSLGHLVFLASHLFIFSS
jgi:hypothetical protein